MEKIWLQALEEEPNLMEYAVNKNIIVATPMTLIALMKTIFIGWKHIKFEKETEIFRNSLNYTNRKMVNIKELVKNIGKKNLEIIEDINRINSIISRIEQKMNLDSDVDLKSLSDQDINLPMVEENIPNPLDPGIFENDDNSEEKHKDLFQKILNNINKK